MTKKRDYIPTDKEYNEYINSQKGLSPRQKEVLIERSQQTWFRQYAKNSKAQLVKLTKTVRKQIKEWRGKTPIKQEREDVDARGFEPPKPKGTSESELKDKLQEIKKENITKEQKMQKKKTYRKIYNQRPEVKEANRLRKQKTREKRKVK